MTNENEVPKKPKDKELGDLLAIVRQAKSTVEEETEGEKA